MYHSIFCRFKLDINIFSPVFESFTVYTKSYWAHLAEGNGLPKIK